MSEQKDPNRAYQVLIDKDLVLIYVPQPTGRHLLEEAKKTPVEQFAIYLKQPGEQPKRIQLNETVDLSAPGVERFVTLPLDQTEGEASGISPRRHFSLPEEDMDWLVARGTSFELVAEPGAQRVLIHGFAVPPGYTHSAVTACVRIDPGYPETQIDMVWFYPALAKSQPGQPIAAISDEQFDGKNWQRWSRHRTGVNPWRPGIDNLMTHYALVEDWLHRELKKG